MSSVTLSNILPSIHPFTTCVTVTLTMLLVLLHYRHNTTSVTSCPIRLTTHKHTRTHIQTMSWGKAHTKKQSEMSEKKQSFPSMALLFRPGNNRTITEWRSGRGHMPIYTRTLTHNHVRTHTHTHTHKGTNYLTTVLYHQPFSTIFGK